MYDATYHTCQHAWQSYQFGGISTRHLSVVCGRQHTQIRWCTHTQCACGLPHTLDDAMCLQPCVRECLLEQLQGFRKQVRQHRSLHSPPTFGAAYIWKACRQQGQWEWVAQVTVLLLHHTICGCRHILGCKLLNYRMLLLCIGAQ
jgi:hypothetical protein